MSQEKQNKIIEQVKHTMACEGMILTESDIQNGRDILTGQKTVEQVIAEETSKMKKEGLIK